MSANIVVNKDPRSFMFYKGEYYINGTEIVLSDEYINNKNFNGKKLWRYARFDHQTQYNGINAYFFCVIKFDTLSFREMNIDINTKKEYAMYFIIESYNVESAIKRILKPIKLANNDDKKIQEYIIDSIERPKTDWDYPELRIGWLIYIIVMITSLIFNQFYILWLIVSYIFFVWRKDILK
jgi:hypothetical protein